MSKLRTDELENLSGSVTILVANLLQSSDLTATNTTYDNTSSGLTATDVQAAVDEVDGNLDTLESSFNSHTGSGGSVHATATTLVEGFMSTSDKTKLNGIETAATADQDASEVPYDNTASGLTASDVQAAIDEVDSEKLDTTSQAVDSDLLDGQEGTHYLDRTNHTGTQTLSTISDSGTAASAGTKNSVEIDTGDIQLVGDSAAPGNDQFYGTDGTGTKGFRSAVTSVGLSAPTGFDVTGSPVIDSGTLALAFASGYSLPTDSDQSNWDSAYDDLLVRRHTLAYRSTNQTAPSGTTTIIEFNAEDVDDLNGWDSADPTRVYVPSDASIVIVTISAAFGTPVSDGTERLMYARKSGQANYTGRPAQRVPPVGSTVYCNAVSAPIQVTTGDYFDLAVNHNAGSDLSISSFGGTALWLSVEVVE